MLGTYAIKFERSSDQRAVITDAAQTGLDLSSTLTLEAWIKPTAQVGIDQNWAICLKHNAGANQRGYLWYFRETGAADQQMRLLISGAGTGTFDAAIGRPGALVGQWHHCAITYDIALSMPDSVTYYIDGEVVLNRFTDLDQGPTSIFDNTADFEVGGSAYSSFSSNLQIAELRVWNIVRTQGQIQALMNSQAVGNESGLVLCCHFDNDLTDATSNGNDLTPVNSPTFVDDDTGENRYAGALVLDEEIFSSPIGGFTGSLIEIIGPATGPDTTAPVIANLTPVSGNLAATRAAAASQPIEFDVTDLDPGLRMVLVVIKLAGDPKRYVVHDGSDFIWPYNGAVSARTAITDGYHYTILPTMGWQDDITELFVYAVDAAGNLEGALP